MQFCSSSYILHAYTVYMCNYGNQFFYKLHLSIILDYIVFYHSFVFLKIDPNSVERLQTNSSKELNFIWTMSDVVFLYFPWHMFLE